MRFARSAASLSFVLILVVLAQFAPSCTAEEKGSSSFSMPSGDPKASLIVYGNQRTGELAGSAMAHWDQNENLRGGWLEPGYKSPEDCMMAFSYSRQNGFLPAGTRQWQPGYVVCYRAKLEGVTGDRPPYIFWSGSDTTLEGAKKRALSRPVDALPVEKDTIELVYVAHDPSYMPQIRSGAASAR